MSTAWLPDLILLESFGGDWMRYLEQIHARFKVDFLDSLPAWPGKRVGVKRHPEYDSKSATFWHMISEGAVENERTPDLRRCERIAWPRPIMVEYDGADPDTTDCRIRWWTEVRRNETRYHLTTSDFSYLMVVADRGSYVLPWTAYPIMYPSQREKLRKKWEAFWR